MRDCLPAEWGLLDARVGLISGRLGATRGRSRSSHLLIFLDFFFSKEKLVLIRDSLPIPRRGQSSPDLFGLCACLCGQNTRLFSLV